MSLRAALLVAKTRYGDIAAFGDAIFIRRVQALGKELGIDVQAGTVANKRAVRQRSPRIEQRYDVIRKWLQETQTRRLRRARSDLWEMLLQPEDEVFPDDLRSELPSNPPPRVIGLGEVDSEALARRGVMTGQRPPREPGLQLEP